MRVIAARATQFRPKSIGTLRSLYQTRSRTLIDYQQLAYQTHGLVRHYARCCTNRPPSISKRIHSQSRRLEAACFMRYALCSATDQLLATFRRWLIDVSNDARKQVDDNRPDVKKQFTRVGRDN